MAISFTLVALLLAKQVHSLLTSLRIKILPIAVFKDYLKQVGDTKTSTSFTVCTPFTAIKPKKLSRFKSQCLPVAKLKATP